jgi:hypothetical protein
MITTVPKNKFLQKRDGDAMLLPYMKPIKNEHETQSFNPGMGENQFGTPFTINEAESRKSLNLSSRAFPAMQTRPGRAHAFTAITTPNALGARDNQYPHVQDGTAWKRWDGSTWQTVQGSLTSARAKIVDFTTGTTKSTILVNGTDKYSWDGSTVTNLTNFPLTSKVAVHKGRVYALVGREVKFSALNLINDWTTANNAGSITITKATSDGLAIIEYADHIVVLTGSSMHELHGTGPMNYELIDISGDGCVADRTLIEAKGVLYWLDHGEFKAYSGGMPVTISQKIQDYLKGIPDAYKYKCCCGKLGKYLYLSIPYGNVTENNLLLEYDTELKQWYPQSGNFVDFVTIGEKLYGIDSTGQIWDMDNGNDDAGTAITWYKESGAYIRQSLRQKKNLQNVYILFNQPDGSTFTVGTSSTVDANDFVTRQTFTDSTSEQNQKITFDANILDYVDWYRLKLAGTGLVTIHAIEQYYRMER